MLVSYLPVVFDVVEWTAHVQSYRTKRLQCRVLDKVAKYKSFSVTMADSLTTCADKLAEFIGIDDNVGFVNLEPSYFLEWFVLVDVTVSHSD